MFNKPKADTTDAANRAAADLQIPDLPDLGRNGQQPARSVSAPSRGASTLTAALVFEGNVVGAGELIVDGQVKGDLKVGRLTIGESGSVEGSIKADTVEVRGKVVGSITGKQVRLLGTAYVDGDINHEQLAIEVGAFFQGRCTQNRPAAAQPSPQPAPRAPEITPPGISSVSAPSAVKPADAPKADAKP